MRIILQRYAGESLKARALRSSVITFFSYGAEQALRLLANLILSRLLFPEAFGVMALVSVVLVGLNMISDVGINTSIIQNPRGEDGVFRNTAWSVQIIRGFVLWFLTVAFAYPVSLWYAEPELFPILCVIGSVAVMQGFATTSIAVRNRHLRLVESAGVQVGGQLLGLLMTVMIAYYYRSVWALVWGNVISSLITVLLGHCVLNKGFKHRWQLDRRVVGELLSFGKWIFFSSILGFLANNADKLILGKLLTFSDLGMYSIAIALAGLPWAIFVKISTAVLLPVYAEVNGQGGGQLRKKVFATRLRVVGVLYPIALGMLIFGGVLIDLMYDHRYADAGWMLQVLSISFCIAIATDTNSFYLGAGRVKYFALLTAIKSALITVSMFIGGSYWGGEGVLYGHVVATALLFLVQSIVNVRFGIWIWEIDIPLVFVAGVAGYFCLY